MEQDNPDQKQYACSICDRSLDKDHRRYTGVSGTICNECIQLAYLIMLNSGSVPSKKVIQSLEMLRQFEAITNGHSHIYMDVYDHFARLINKAPEPKPEEEDIPDITA